MSDTVPRGAFLRPELPAEALHGLPGEVTNAFAEASDADPAALLLSFLTMLGNATGAEPHITIGGQPQPGRLFVLIVGDAATGRKGTALALIQSLFEEADPEWAATCIMTGAQSGEAIVGRVADDVLTPDRDKRLLLLEPEYGRLLERMGGSTLSPTLRRAWDGSTLAAERTRSRSSLKATHAHLSMIGQITPAELLHHYPRLSAGNGLESRCLYAYVTKQDKEVSPFAAAHVSEALSDRVAAVLEGARWRSLEGSDPLSRDLCTRRGLMPSTTMLFGDDVEEGWRTIQASFPEVNRELGGFFDREFTHVMRLAVLYALADASPHLEMEHVRAAVALWTYCARSAETIFSIPVGTTKPDIDPRRRGQVWDVLYRSYPEWLATTQLNDAFSRNVGKNRTDIAAVADSLVTDGQAEVRKVGTKGRPRIEYRLVPPTSTKNVKTSTQEVAK